MQLQWTRCGRTGVLALLLASMLAAEPRPMSPAERSAAQLLHQACTKSWSDFEKDLDSWWSDLDTDARRSEWQVRTGSSSSSCADWTLWTVDADAHPGVATLYVEHPSGIDDVVFLHFDDKARLQHVWTWAERPPLALAESNARLREPVPPITSPSVLANSIPIASGAAIAVGCLLLICSGRRRNSPRSSMTRSLPAAAAYLVVAISVGTQACGGRDAATTLGGPAATTDQNHHPRRPVRLGGLLPLRTALNTSPEAMSAARLETQLALAEAPADPSTDGIRALWMAQAALLQDDASAAASWLELSRETTQGSLLLDLVESRALLDRGKGVEAQSFLRAALEHEPTADGLLAEAAGFFEGSNAIDKEREALERAASFGSRLGSVYYQLARLRTYDGELDAAKQALETAYDLDPWPRSHLLRDPFLSFHLEPDTQMYTRLALASAEEPTPSPALGESVLFAFVGDQIEVEAHGRSARLRWPTGTLTLPGGHDLVPPTTRRRQAGAWTEERELTALRRVQDRRTEAGQIDFARISERDLELAAVALARRGDWQDLVALTENISPRSPNAPTDILSLRAVALERQGFRESARKLLLALVRTLLEQGRREPGVLYQLADVLAYQGDFTTAKALVQRAEQQFSSSASTAKIQQYTMEARLAEESSFHATENFSVRHPSNRAVFARRISGVLEAELTRLRGWIPPSPRQRLIQVHLLSVDDFIDRYAGRVDIVGIYDGRIRVPLAELWGYHPQLVSILTHELAHALIADVTSERAPKWVHEGLAQLVEMHSVRSNPMPSYARAGRILSLSMLEEVLGGFPNAKLVATAYDQALWTFVYLEEKHGRKSIAGLLEAFREGRSTEEALQQVYGVDSQELDRRLRRWWLREAPRALEQPIRDYQNEYGFTATRSGLRYDAGIDQKWWRRDG